MGSGAGSEASDLLACDLEDEASLSLAGLDGPADATDASVSAAAIIAELVMMGDVTRVCDSASS